MAGRHRRAAPARQAPADASHRNRMLAITGVVAAVIALAVILPILLSGGGDGDRSASGTSPTARTSAPAAPTTPAPSASPSVSSPASTATSSPAPATTTSAPPAKKPPTLLVRADRGNSWLTVSDARGHRIFDALLRRGATRTFDGAVLHVVIGDAASVDVVVNGDPRPRGRRGAVIRFTVRA
ncbi:MAG: DUF4115 domain-containing protein [Frankiaceae bacterium]